MKKLLFFPAFLLIMMSCSKQGNGELVGVHSKTWTEPVPYGMIHIKRGSFTMGSNDQDAFWASNMQSKTVSVEPFWMDETEITNSEYRQFVHYVRDSIVLTKLAVEDDAKYLITTADINGNDQTRLNWKVRIPWNAKKATDEEKLAVASMFYQGDDAIELIPQLNATILNYEYTYADYKQAAKKENKFNSLTGAYNVTGKNGDTVKVIKDVTNVLTDPTTGADFIENKTISKQLTSRGDFISKKVLNIYPDTMCWIRDFTYSYNEPYMKMYFSHPGYQEYPVVGVTWEQASAFCDWRTRTFNKNQIDHKGQLVQDWRLPNEAEWEYAARGGRELSMYPWGGPYIRSAKGCFLANFKPMRGNYQGDGFNYTAGVAAYPPNDYGLWDMAGNVAEWTADTYSESTPSFVHDLNAAYQVNVKTTDPDVKRRKVVKGGSWKDIGAYLQCGNRQYEYQQESKSYIGFRCVRSTIGEKK